VSPDRAVLNLVGQMCGRVPERGGLFESRRGVPLGCLLSPLLGVFFPREMDRRLEETGLFFVRFMADVLVLAPPGWNLWHVMLGVWMLFLMGQPWYQSTQVAAIPYSRVLAYQAGGVSPAYFFFFFSAFTFFFSFGVS
jgi:hypothetical protein